MMIKQEPTIGFLGLFSCDFAFVYEVCAAFRALGLAHIGSNGGAASHQLLRHHKSALPFQALRVFNNQQREFKSQPYNQIICFSY